MQEFHEIPTDQQQLDVAKLRSDRRGRSVVEKLMTGRILVVGCSALSCLGKDLDSTWDGLIAGRSGLRRHESLAPQSYLQAIGGMVENFGPGTDSVDPAIEKLPVRSIHLALAAARAAVSDAGLHGEMDFDPHRVAVVVGSSMGGMDLIHAEQTRMLQRKTLKADPYLIPGFIVNMAASQIAQHLGFHGPSVAPSNACATGGYAIALGAMLLGTGEIDFALCGAAESVFTPMIVNGFVTMRALFCSAEEDRGVEHPCEASRPFSIDRAGFVLSEGAAMILLATESAARRFGLRPRAVLRGWALNSDGHHVSLPYLPSVAACVAKSLESAGVRADQIDYYNAHGTSTVVNDMVETRAVKEVFGRYARDLPVSSIKGAIGHSLGAASAIEAVTCVKVLEEQIIPPTINYRPDPDLDLDYVSEGARAARIETVLSASFGFGGTNSSLVFGRWND